MKKLLLVLVIGLLLLYPLDAALKINLFSLDMYKENLIRLLLGFSIFAIWSLAKIKVRIVLYLILLFFISDIIFGYVYEPKNLSIEMFSHDLFFFFWGALFGVFSVKYLREKNLNKV